VSGPAGVGGASAGPVRAAVSDEGAPSAVGCLARALERPGWVGALSLWSLVERRAAATPGRVLAVEDTGARVTFGDYRDRCLVVAAGLARRSGVGEGTPVSWELPTSIESLVLVGALARLGARQNPIIPIYRGREVGFVTRQSGARLLVVPPSYRGFDFAAMAAEVAAATDGLEVLVVDRTLPEADPASLPPPAPDPGGDEDAPVRWVFYTSGTTADPKGAQHTDLTVLASALAMSECLAITEDDVSALVFPFTHIGGIGWLLAALVTGCSLLVTEAFDPVATPAFLAAHGVTLAGSGTPFHQAYLAAQRARAPGSGPLFPAVRAYPGGGAPKPPQLHRDVRAEIGGLGIVSGYGLTEAPIVAMATVDDPDDKLAETEGRPTAGVTIRVVDLEGRVLPAGEEGELRVRGPQVLRGYLDASLDAAAFDEDGYFRTGDLGRLDAEGYVTITGRLKDVIIRNGENISAKEVEDLLYAHPAVADAAVVGLPDERTGERACAVVALRPGAGLDLEDVRSFLVGAGLRVQAVPEQLEVVDAVPRNPAGKVLKQALRDRYATGGAGPPG
jgi:cyclohexanecarboxylate-CoA ligase